MGKSTSCFKIITCGGDSDETSDAIPIHVPESESKRSNDKKGWSFRKKSERHRVLSNTIVQEAAPGLKESPESAGCDFQQTDVSVAREKTSTIQYIEEKPRLQTPEEYIKESESVVPKKYTEEKSELVTPIAYTEEKTQLSTQEDIEVPEHVPTPTNDVQVDANLDESVVIIIQTAIRGFLAHKELGKLKGLVKLQAAVRGHLVRRHAVGTLRCVQAIVKMQVLVRARRARLSQQGSNDEKKLDGRRHNDNQSSVSSAIKQTATYTSIEKLLSNRFARQLMDSTPKAKLRIKCDPSKPNSVWSWLEMWMSVSSQDNFKFEECQSASSSVMDDLEQPQIDNRTSDLKEISQDINSQDQMTQTDAHSQTEVVCLSKKPEIESEQAKRSAKSSASEQLETEAKKFVLGSRKVSNPAFIAAQTKFEELSSTANSSKSIDSSHQDVGVEPTLDTVSSGADTISRSKEPSIREIAVVSNGRVQYGDSERGTGLSITSTLGSPDKSEVGTIGYEHGAKVSDQENCSSNSIEDLDAKDNESSAITVPDSSLPLGNQPEQLDDAKSASVNLIVTDSPQVEQEQLKGTSDQQREPDSETGNQAYRSSPEASPRSHMIVPESQETPSSEVSVKTKKKNKDKSGQKRKSLSATKSSPSTPAHDNGARSLEQLPKDQKNGKTRNSFGSTRPEDKEDEPRDSNSSNSLPRFMQATESARAKVSPKNSTRSSPDAQDRDIYIKKRLSLPAANWRQGSPKIQLPVSQAQQGAKGNTIHEKWQR